METTLTRIFSTKIPAYFENILHEFPRDLNSAIQAFNIKTKETIYAVCPDPDCHATYKPEYDGDLKVYPLRCTHRKYKSRCGRLLVRQKRIGKVMVNVPIKTYITFDFDHWMAELLSRPGYEKSMDAAWEKMTPRTDGLITDIFQGSVIRNFMAANRTVHFSQYGGEEAGHYLFSLGFDFFNPGRSMRGGKPVSIGAITLVCLNLPIETRYRIENIFLAGIVPGPKEPPVECINPYFRPLVDALLVFWTGIWFSRTAEYSSGRLVLCAIILVVCDLQAARKVGGFAAPTATRFCTVCHCHRDFKSPHNTDDIGYNNFDIGSWQPRTTRNWLKNAEKWCRCNSNSERKRCLIRNGVRWSELLRLPYYEPSRFLVVDPMHNLFLGLIHEHFRGIFGYAGKDKKKSDSENSSNKQRNPPRTAPESIHQWPGRLPDIQLTPHATNYAPTTTNDISQVQKLLQKLQAPIAGRTREELAKKFYRNNNLPALIYVGRGLGCIDHGIGPKGLNTERKKVMSKAGATEALADWRIGRIQPGDEVGLAGGPAETETIPEAQPSNSEVAGTNNIPEWKRSALFTDGEMESIWDDLENIVTPSWVTSITSAIPGSGHS